MNRANEAQKSTYCDPVITTVIILIITHYRMTFAKSQTLTHLSAIQNFTFFIVIFTYRPRLCFSVVRYVKSVIRYWTDNIVISVQ